MTKLDLKNWRHRKFTTRDGREVRLAAVDGPGEYPIAGHISGDSERWDVTGWRLDGSWHDGMDGTNDDLINAPEEPVFVPGWFWCKRNNGPMETQHITSSLKGYNVVCRIPSPDELEAIKDVAINLSKDISGGLYIRPTSSLREVLNFFSIDA